MTPKECLVKMIQDRENAIGGDSVRAIYVQPEDFILGYARCLMDQDILPINDCLAIGIWMAGGHPDNADLRPWWRE